MTSFVKAKLAMLALFLAISGGLATYYFMYTLPGQKCEEGGAWWANKWRRCVTPIAISNLTGRPNTAPLPPAPEQVPAKPDKLVK